MSFKGFTAVGTKDLRNHLWNILESLTSQSTSFHRPLKTLNIHTVNAAPIIANNVAAPKYNSPE